MDERIWERSHAIILLDIINKTEAMRENVSKIEEQTQRIVEQNKAIIQQNDQLRELVLIARNEWQDTKRWMRAPFWKRWMGTY